MRVAGISICIALGLSATGVGPAEPAVSSVDSPNIVLILSDDQGWSQLSDPMDPGVDGASSDYLETPNMSRLAREGMRFTSGYAPAPLCTPTRRSILCGTSAARSGTEFASEWVPSEHMTIPKALKKANASYRCAHFGKWGKDMLSSPEDCGYDESDGTTDNATGGMPRSLGVASGEHDDGPPHFIDDEDAKRTRTSTNRAIDFMRDSVGAERPFFVQVSYYAVHLSVVCRGELLKKYTSKSDPDRKYTAAWAAMLEEMDTGVGRLLDAIESLGIDENTYVFFASDNGAVWTVPGAESDRLETNHPLLGAKHTLFEGGIRVPFIVRGPGIEPGSECRRPVSGYDLLPTFHALAGGSGTLSDEVDGTSIAPLLSEPADEAGRFAERALYFHRPDRRVSAIRRGDYKLMLLWRKGGKVRSRALFRVDPDPQESERDIAASQPRLAGELEAQLMTHLREVGARGLGGPRTESR